MMNAEQFKTFRMILTGYLAWEMSYPSVNFKAGQMIDKRCFLTIHGGQHEINISFTVNIFDPDRFPDIKPENNYIDTNNFDLDLAIDGDLVQYENRKEMLLYQSLSFAASDFPHPFIRN